jgi:hypothetical protein
VALFIEGVIEGVIEEEKFTDLQNCIQLSVEFEDEVNNAINDLESETFEGIRSGLEEIGKAIRIIPTMVHECQ